MQKTALLALPLLALSSAHASIANPRIYPTEGSIQCNASEDLKGKDTIILFVNGIANSINSTKQSHEALERLYQDCTTCDVRYSYNQGDTRIIFQNKNDPNAGDAMIASDDIHELHLVSRLQLEAIHHATSVVLSKIKDDNSIRINKIKKELNIIDDKKPFIYKHYEIDSINRLKELNNSSFEKFDKLVDEMYNPITQGTDFAKAFTQFIEKADTSKWIFFNGLSREEKLFTKEFFLQATQSQKNALNRLFSTEYRKNLTEKYMSERELYSQDNTASQGITKTVEHLKHEIEEYVLSGRKVIIVAHSQGNHMAELAYSSLLKQYELDPQQTTLFMNAIRVVGVASVSSTTPHNSYITWDKDHTVLDIYTFRKKSGTSNTPLKPNFMSEENDNDTMDHNFNKVYLADDFTGKYFLPINVYDRDKHPAILKNTDNAITPRNVIKNLIDGARLSASPMPAQIKTNSLLTAKLNWEHWNDMDLHITEPEPNRAKISFRNKKGHYGFLDRDDTDGHGPEHYYINQGLTCNDLSNKQWNFSVNQYPRGGSNAIVHFMLKIGDNQVQSRSFGLNKWPSSTVPLGKVTFGNYTAGSNKLGYKMEIFDSGDD